jgi:hypothetical protein
MASAAGNSTWHTQLLDRDSLESECRFAAIKHRICEATCMFNISIPMPPIKQLRISMAATTVARGSTCNELPLASSMCSNPSQQQCIGRSSSNEPLEQLEVEHLWSVRAWQVRQGSMQLPALLSKRGRSKVAWYSMSINLVARMYAISDPLIA